MKVMKFGGGCLKNAENFLSVKELIRTEYNERREVVVVVSAVFGVTNLLIDGLTLSQEEIEPVISKIKSIHYTIANESIIKFHELENTLDILSLKIDELRKLFLGVTYTGELSNHIRSHIISFGERLSAILLSGVLNGDGLKSIEKESDVIGIITDDFSDNATAILPIVFPNFKHFRFKCMSYNCCTIISPISSECC